MGERARSARPDFVVQDLRQIRWRQGRLQVACPAPPHADPSYWSPWKVYRGAARLVGIEVTAITDGLLPGDEVTGLIGIS